MKTAHYPPEFQKAEFNCMHCGVYSAQKWDSETTHIYPGGNYSDHIGLYQCYCRHCGGYSIWREGDILIPASSTAPLPHPDLPAECEGDFSEARAVLSKSPKAAAALLRLCVQRLLVHLGGDGKHINSDIKGLVDLGLPPLVQQALDYCRVVGNNAVHPGEINVNDSPEIANSLFEMINFIVEDRIARPKEVEALYSSLPQGARDAIDKRDGKQQSPPVAVLPATNGAMGDASQATP